MHLVSGTYLLIDWS